MAKVVSKPEERPRFSQEEIDALLAPKGEELRRHRLQLMLSQGFVLDDLHADFVTRFRRIHRAYDRGELSDGEFEEQANLFVQEYLQDRMMGAEIGMIRDSYLVRLADLSANYDGEELRRHAYSALRDQLKERDSSI